MRKVKVRFLSERCSKEGKKISLLTLPKYYIIFSPSILHSFHEKVKNTLYVMKIRKKKKIKLTYIEFNHKIPLPNKSIQIVKKRKKKSNSN